MLMEVTVSTNEGTYHYELFSLKRCGLGLGFKEEGKQEVKYWSGERALEKVRTLIRTGMDAIKRGALPQVIGTAVLIKKPGTVSMVFKLNEAHPAIFRDFSELYMKAFQEAALGDDMDDALEEVFSFIEQTLGIDMKNIPCLLLGE